MATEEDLRLGMEPVPQKRLSPDNAVAYIQEHLPILAKSPHFEGWLDQQVRRLLEQADAGEELWWCQSRYRGPLAGHEGLGLVKGGSVLRYEVVVRY